MSNSDSLGLIGQVFAGKYRIEREVGSGSFAAVYRAEHLVWKIPVAVKCFKALSEVEDASRKAMLESFINEGALLARLSSATSAIVQAYDVGEVTSPRGQWLPYMVLEWLDGATLEDWIERVGAGNQWSIPEMMAVIAPIAQALDVAHRNGVAHRDVKPANTFVIGGDPRTAAASIKILDFGIAKTMADCCEISPQAAKTGMNLASFTPQYGAPEQFSRKYGATGPWTDVFALGLLGVELLVGRHALDGNDVAQLGFAAVDPLQRPSPRTLGVSVPDEVEAVFQRAVAVDPGHRYATAGEFIAALGVATGPIDPASFPAALSQGTRVSSLPRALPTPGAAADSRARTTLSHSLSLPGPQRGLSRKVRLLGSVAIVALGIGGILGASRLRHEGVPARKVPTGLAAFALPGAEGIIDRGFGPRCPAGQLLIPAGQYFMGSQDESALSHERPLHNVKLQAFCLDETEVTVKAYRECSDRGACPAAGERVFWPGIARVPDVKRAAFDEACNIRRSVQRASHPINCVGWNSAERYCREQGARLPTEAEWEYAARGPDGRRYPWGNELPTAEHLNACGSECVRWQLEQLGIAPNTVTPLYDHDDGFPTTSPVGSFPKGSSRFGPKDIVGNVWEWVADYYGAYSGSDQVDPKGPDTGEERVLRGGAFNGTEPGWLRPSYRFKMSPESRSWGVGFRCASDPL